LDVFPAVIITDVHELNADPMSLSVTIKERQSIYTMPFILHSLKVLRHGSHSFNCKLHYAYLFFISIHQMMPPLTEVADIQLQLTNLLTLVIY